ncbi:MAG: MlaD family protein [Solirubrobacteraceae bacterium]
MRRNRNASVVANPVLVGAVTTLVVVVAVFLSYNANSGLPFVPTRQLNVLIANGANLVKGNEVRSGGFRVGVVNDLEPVKLPNGQVGAKLQLKLDKKIGAIPVDSTVTIRPRSALGLKYVELDTGKSRKTFADGATLPEKQAKVPVEIDQVFNMFDQKTRDAEQQNLQGFGDALAGRGQALNETLQSTPELFGRLRSVAANLADPKTDLTGFIGGLGRTMRVVAPVSKTNARLFTTMANTFDALSRNPEALRQTISKNPPTLAVGTESLRVQRPFLAHTAAFAHDLRGAVDELPATLPVLNTALRVGTKVQARMPQLNKPLQQTFAALEDLVKQPTTNGALRGLTATVDTLQPTLRYVGPFVTVCNNWNYFWTLAAEHQTAPDASGSAQRVLLNVAGAQQPGTDSVGSAGANEFAHGKGAQGTSAPEYLHGNYNGPAVNDKGDANCGAGQTGYVAAANPYRDTSIKGDPYKNAVVETGQFVKAYAERKDLAGPKPLYAQIDRNGKGVGLGPTHVPAGETFTARPGGRGADLARP